MLKQKIAIKGLRSTDCNSKLKKKGSTFELKIIHNSTRWLMISECKL